MKFGEVFSEEELARLQSKASRFRLFRTAADKFREEICPNLLNAYMKYRDDCSDLKDNLQMTMRVNKQQAVAIEELLAENDRLRGVICDQLTAEAQKNGEY